MEQEQAIAGLKAQGWSDRKIAKELGLNRRTVKRYNDSKCTIPQTGKRGRKSQCAGHQSEITKWYESGLSIERIHSDLVRECDFKGSYHSVYRFVQSLNISEVLRQNNGRRFPGYARSSQSAGLKQPLHSSCESG